MSWGEIYNTSWWGVALDTARTVKARPDFFGSQLNLLTSEQPNLVTNGTFDTDSDWGKGLGWSIGDGVATCDGTNQQKIFQNIGLTTNKNYKFTIEIKTLTSGSIKLLYYTGSYQTIASNLGIGTHTIEFNTSGSVNGFIYIESTNFIGSIDNVSVQVARAELDQIEAKKCLADWIHTTALKDLNN